MISPVSDTNTCTTQKIDREMALYTLKEESGSCNGPTTADGLNIGHLNANGIVSKTQDTDKMVLTRIKTYDHGFKRTMCLLSLRQN